jgi:hypothetical protein
LEPSYNLGTPHGTAGNIADPRPVPGPQVTCSPVMFLCLNPLDFHEKYIIAA